MSSVFLYSDLFLPTFPLLDVPLYAELCRLGLNPTYILQNGDIRLSLPGVGDKFKSIKTLLVKNPKKDIPNVMKKGDLLCMPFRYKNIGGDTMQAVKSGGKNILALDPAAVDLKHRQCPSTYITSKSVWMTKQVNKKFPKAYKKIFTTGTIHFDAHFQIQGQIHDKSNFYNKYGLDINKKLALITPASPGEAWMNGIQDDYKMIVKIAQNCGYQILFKGHPLDYTASMPAVVGIVHKNEHYKNKHSWEVIAPKSKVVEAIDGCLAFKMADVCLNIRSSIAMEAPIYNIPLININSHKYTVNWPKSNEPGIMKNIEIKELEKVLRNCDYFSDRDARDTYLKTYCDPVCDGRAYKRTADTIKELLQ